MISKMESISEINLQEGYLNDAWTILWNLTDSNYENCKVFLLNGGLDAFLHSKNRLDSQKNVILMKCILGPIMNLSEFKDYRGELRKKIGFVQELVSVIEDDFEISYMAIGIIANLALDGPDVWNLEEFDFVNLKEKILVKMYTWSLESKLGINCSSFESILRLLKLCHEPYSQYWAMWTLAYFAKKEGKYKNMWLDLYSIQCILL